MRALEVLTAEQAERPQVEWFNPLDHQQVIAKILKNYAERKVSTKGEDITPFSYMAEGVFYLKKICESSPDLLALTPERIDAIANTSLALATFGLHSSWLSAGGLKPANQKALEGLWRRKNLSGELLAEPLEMQIKDVFYIAVGAPRARRLVGRLIKDKWPEVKQLLLEDDDVLLVAYLILLYPEKREEVIGFLPPQSLQKFGRKVSGGERRVMDHGVAADEDLPKLFFAQQVLASKHASIDEQGNINFIPPGISTLRVSPSLPTREII